MKILFFDTETTGLIPCKGKNIHFHNLDKWPHIVQFSYLIFNTETYTIEKIVNEIIRVPSHVTISDECIAIHSVTNEMSKQATHCFTDILHQFMDDLNKVNQLVAHNIEFDRNVCLAEILRIVMTEDMTETEIDKYETYTEKLIFMTDFCTMKHSVDLCRIQFPRSFKSEGIRFKFPKLVELHETLFKTIPNKAHDALIDIYICLRCYCKMEQNTDLYIVNDLFKVQWDTLFAVSTH